MIKSALNFFRQDKLATVVFIVVLAAMAYAAMQEAVPESKKVNYANSEAVQEFRAAEEQLQDQIKQIGSMAKFLKERPRIAMLLNLMTLGGLGLFILGIAVNVTWFCSPELRKKATLTPPEEFTQWGFSMIFKVILYFIFVGGLLSVAFQGLKFVGVNIPMNVYMVFHTTLVDILCVFLIYSVVKVKGGDWKDIGFRLLGKDAWSEVKVGFLAYAAILPIFMTSLIVLVIIAKLTAYEPPSHPLVTVFLEEEQRSLWLVSYSIFLAIFVGPVIEEIFFRGFCYPVLKKSMGKVWAMIATAFFFSLVHGNMFAFVPIFILGFGLTYVYEMRGSLVAPMIIHVTHNLVFITYFFMAKKIIYQVAG